MLHFKISELEKANTSIKIDLRKFEIKYNLKSEEFYNKFEAGKFGDEDDFMIWAGIYEFYIDNKKELSKIK